MTENIQKKKERGEDFLPLFNFLEKFNANSADLYNTVSASTKDAQKDNIQLWQQLAERADRLGGKMRKIIDDKKMNQDEKEAALDELDRQYFSLASQIFNLRRQVVAHEHSPQELAKKIPLDKTYPNLKPDLNGAGLTDFLNLLDLAEKTRGPAQAPNQQQKPKPPANDDINIF